MQIWKIQGVVSERSHQFMVGQRVHTYHDLIYNIAAPDLKVPQSHSCWRRRRVVPYETLNGLNRVLLCSEAE